MARAWIGVVGGLLPMVADAEILWRDSGWHQVHQTNEVMSLAGSRLKAQDNTSSRTLYLRFTVAPLSDGISDKASRYESGWIFQDKGTARLGLGNAWNAWGYSAFHAVQPDTVKHAPGEVDLRSALHDAAKNHAYEIPRIGVERTLVARIQYIPEEDDQITVWIQPDLRPASREDDLPESLTTHFLADASFDQLVLGHRGGGSGWRFGNMAVATRYEDLTEPHLWERPGFFAWSGLCLASAAGLMTWRRARSAELDLVRERAALEAHKNVDAERDRIARDLHDSLGSTLSEISLLSSLAQSSLGFSQDLDRIQRRAQEGVEALEAIVWATDPEADTVAGFIDHATRFATEFLTAAGVRLTLSAHPGMTIAPMAAALRHNTFLAFKETLHNVVKHARASEVHIDFEPGLDRLMVSISDNGRGYLVTPDHEGTHPSRGHGRKNTRTRIESFGGSVEMGHEENGGTRVRFTVPI